MIDRKAVRKLRVRKKLRACLDYPRLSVFISNKHIFAQVIDDKGGKTLVSASDKETGGNGKNLGVAVSVGELLGTKARGKKIKRVVFDRGERKYHGRIKALAEAARQKGLVF